MKEAKNTSFLIAVATHKEYFIPNESIYTPYRVGARGKKTIHNYVRDDSGDNISDLNPYFCELTALYHIWKNKNSEYKGLVHYRRYFSEKEFHSEFKKGKFKDVMSEKKLKKIIEKYDIIVPKRRRYFIETIYSHYQHTHNIEPLDKTATLVKAMYPDYYPSFNKVMQKRSAHMFNMFIMKRELFDNYCTWLFSILFELQKNIDISDYDKQESRVFGYISEFLLDVWLDTNNYNYKEVPVMFMEQQNWTEKIKNFLVAKFL